MEVESSAVPSNGLNVKLWASSMVHLPSLVAKRTFLKPPKEQVLAAADQAGEMKRVLKALDVIMIGIGIILGSGIFVTTGAVAHDNSGPAVIVSYMVAGLSAMLTGLCYTEYSVDFPVAGGSYTYISSTFGELMAWFTVGMMVIQYILANAGVARGFTAYFANLCAQPSDFFIIGNGIDLWGAALVLACTGLLLLGTKQSALFNNVCQFLVIGCVLFVIITGYMFADTSLLVPFTGSFGWRGIFNGASVVFFSFIGFDAISNTAQEVVNPRRDLPIGLIGSLTVITILYVMASLAIVMMVPYYDIDTTAAFSAAFVHVGAQWASFIVAAGACIAIATGVLVGCMTVPRLVAAAARESLIPAIFGRINGRGTPAIATTVCGIITAVIALLSSLDVLLNLTAICVLTVYGIVSCGALWRRYYKRGEMQGPETTLLMVHFFAIIAVSIGLGCAFVYAATWWLEVIILVAWFGITLSMNIFCKQKYLPTGFAIPLQPWTTSLAILFNFFLLCTVPASAFLMYAGFLAILLVIYLIFGIHNAELRDEATKFIKTVEDDEEAESAALAKNEAL